MVFFVAGGDCGSAPVGVAILSRCLSCVYLVNVDISS